MRAEGATSWPTFARRSATGESEIQLLGQIVNHYPAPDDPECDFAQLLERSQRRAGRRADSLREPTSAPHAASASIEAVRDLPRVCKHMHLPVQSGSTRVLGAMRRRHTREEYLDLRPANSREHPGRDSYRRI